MKGNNELKLNTATMIDAVQEYLRRRWSPVSQEPCPTVTDVVANTSTYDKSFTVSLTSDTKP